MTIQSDLRTIFPFLSLEEESVVYNMLNVADELKTTYDFDTHGLKDAILDILQIDAKSVLSWDAVTCLERFCDFELSTHSRIIAGTRVAQLILLERKIEQQIEEETRATIYNDSFERSDLEGLTIINISQLEADENYGDTIVDPEEYIACLSTNGFYYGE